MKKDFLDKQKQKLEQTKQALERGLSNFAAKDPQLKHDWDTIYPNYSRGTENEGLEAEADEVEEYERSLPIEYNLEIKLRNINIALEKIKKGMGYGICEKCQQEIPEQRLEACPEARFCMKCQNK